MAQTASALLLTAINPIRRTTSTPALAATMQQAHHAQFAVAAKAAVTAPSAVLDAATASEQHVAELLHAVTVLAQHAAEQLHAVTVLAQHAATKVAANAALKRADAATVLDLVLERLAAATEAVHRAAARHVVADAAGNASQKSVSNARPLPNNPNHVKYKYG
jgi:hypothetical protein